MVVKNFHKYFESKNYGTLYHMTNMVSLCSILKEDQLCSGKELYDLFMNSEGGTQNRFKELQKTYNFFISTTRDKNFIGRAGGLTNVVNTIIHLDGQKLTHKYKVIPVNYFNYDMDYQKRKNEVDESEEAILLRKGQECIRLSDYCTKLEITNSKGFRDEMMDGITNYDVSYLCDIISWVYKDSLGIEKSSYEIEQTLVGNKVKTDEEWDANVKDIYGILVEYIKKRTKTMGISLVVLDNTHNPPRF